jgi:hypothetical protein
MMFPRAKSVRHVKDHELEVTFANGERRVVPFADEIITAGGEMARPLQKVSYFAKASVNAEAGVLEWPNGFDVDPDILYWLATGKPITFASDPKYHQPPAHLRRPREQQQRSGRRRPERAIKR